MMQLKRWMKVILVSSSILALTACTAKHKMQDDSAINDANSAYSDDADAQSSGLGDDSKFGDQATDRGSLISKRIYYFDFDSNVVRDVDKPAIAANAEKLIAHPSMQVMVEGHTDPRGSREYNIGLGERRAKAVAQILTAKGVSRNQIRVVSYGAEKLASPGRSEADYQRDRRCVLVYLQR
ncbi:MAG TPA: OmpA family protein [Candidatus Saccharimonadales bacterium]